MTATSFESAPGAGNNLGSLWISLNKGAWKTGRWQWGLVMWLASHIAPVAALRTCKFSGFAHSQPVGVSHYKGKAQYCQESVSSSAHGIGLRWARNSLQNKEQVGNFMSADFPTPFQWRQEPTHRTEVSHHWDSFPKLPFDDTLYAGWKTHH